MDGWGWGWERGFPNDYRVSFRFFCCWTATTKKATKISKRNHCEFAGESSKNCVKLMLFCCQQNLSTPTQFGSLAVSAHLRCENEGTLTLTKKWPYFWPQTRAKQTFWFLISNNTKPGQYLPWKIWSNKCQPIFSSHNMTQTQRSVRLLVKKVE